VPAGGLAWSGAVLAGTTTQGGISNSGTLFQINTDGTGYLVRQSFNGGSDGKNPNGGLVASGNKLFGTSRTGGSANNGVVFVSQDLGGGFYSFGTIRDFTTNDGLSLNGGLALNGNTLYGTTFGLPFPIAGGGDKAFKLQTDGTGFGILTNLTYMNPYGDLLFDSGVLYGTSAAGVAFGAGGTVFKITASNTNCELLMVFGDASDPKGRLVLNGGMLYGTTASGGSFNEGTIFKLSTNGTSFTILKHFPARVLRTNSDGAVPVGGLVLSGDTLYGTTSAGGSTSNGVIFRIKTDGSGFAVLKHFPPSYFRAAISAYTNVDGSSPNGNLLMNNGTLYGMTSAGGTAGKGVVFRFIVPPQIRVDDQFGVRTNRFGFNVAGVSNQAVVIEASTNLARTNWTAVRIQTLGTNPYYFSDSTWTNYPARFYRVRVQ
jgi:uncharacterized repeat protein (TIGR03803 family)